MTYAVIITQKRAAKPPGGCLFRVWRELKIETDIFSGFGVEEFLNVAVDSLRKFGDALVGTSFVFAGDEWNDVTIFSFDAGAVAILFHGIATIDASGALEFAEGVANGFVAAAENPVDDFALVHSIEIVDREIIMKLHGLDNVSVEL